MLIISGGYLLAKIVFWIFNFVVKRATAKTKTKIDDIIVDMIEEPFVFGIIIAAFWYGLAYLNMSEGVENFTHKVFYILITFDVSWLIVRLIDAILIEVVTPIIEKSDSDLDDQIFPIIRKSIKTVIWIVALVVGLSNAGYDVGALIAGLGLGGLAFAMAAKDSVANLFGGVTVFMDKPFKLNDRINIAGFDGTIKEIGIRTTRLVTLAGRVVTIPNSKFAGTEIENVSSEPSRKKTMTLGLTYDTSPEKMQEAVDILGAIVKENDSLKEDYYAFFDSYGDFSMNIFFIYYIIKGEDIVKATHWVNMEILKRFNQAGLDFAFPTQTIITQTEN